MIAYDTSAPLTMKEKDGEVLKHILKLTDRQGRSGMQTTIWKPGPCIQLQDILEKAKLWRQSKGQWLTEAGEEEVMSRGSTEDVLGQSNYSV